MKNKKLIWKILLIIGFIPFFIGLLYGIVSALNGFSALCFMCEKEYGINAFFDSILLYSYVFWPAYIIGVILIILAILKIRK